MHIYMCCRLIDQRFTMDAWEENANSKRERTDRGTEREKETKREREREKTYECVCHAYKRVMSHIWISHIACSVSTTSLEFTHKNGSRHEYECTNINELCHKYEWVTSHTNESCQNFERYKPHARHPPYLSSMMTVAALAPPPHIWIYRVTHMNGSRHTYVLKYVARERSCVRETLLASRIRTFWVWRRTSARRWLFLTSARHSWISTFEALATQKKGGAVRRENERRIWTGLVWGRCLTMHTQYSIISSCIHIETSSSLPRFMCPSLRGVEPADNNMSST